MVKLALVLMLTAGAFAADPADDHEPENEPPEVLFLEDAPPPVIRPDPLDVADNLETIIDRSGTIRGPWRRSRGCVAQHCAEMIADSRSGEVAFFDGEWLGGFVATGRGAEVVRIRRPEAERRTEEH